MGMSLLESQAVSIRRQIQLSSPSLAALQNVHAQNTTVTNALKYQSISPKSTVKRPSTFAPAKFTATPAPGLPAGRRDLVWVNTETHTYLYYGSRFYGTSKKGKYVREADAIKEGDKPARPKPEHPNPDLGKQ
jgi:hypothetical protein